VSTFWGEHHSLAETLKPSRKVIMKKLRQMIIIINLKTIVVTVLPILYGPYFAAIAQDYSGGLAM
jgi:hypothetical protein